MFRVPEILKEKAAPLVAFLCDFSVFQVIESHLDVLFLEEALYKAAHFNPGEFILPLRQEKKTEPESAKPKGILKMSWVSKHRYIIPSCVVYMIKMSENDSKKNALDEEKLRSLYKLKNFTKTRYLPFVVCVVPEEGVTEIATKHTAGGGIQELRGRIWKKCTNLESTDGFALLNTNKEFFDASMKNLNEVVVDAYSPRYEAECARIKKLRDLLLKKYFNPLHIRFSFKLGFFYECINKREEAISEYRNGYEMLLDDIGRSDSMAKVLEMKGIGGVLLYKIIQHLLKLGRVEESYSVYNKHIRDFRQFGGPIADLLFTHFEYLANNGLDVADLYIRRVKQGDSISPVGITPIVKECLQYLDDWRECSHNLLAGFVESEESLELIECEYFFETPKSIQTHPLESLDDNRSEEDLSIIIKTNTVKRDVQTEIIVALEKIVGDVRDTSLRSEDTQLSIILAGFYEKIGLHGKSLPLFYSSLGSFRRLGWRNLMKNTLERILSAHFHSNNIFSFVKDALEYLGLFGDEFSGNSDLELVRKLVLRYFRLFTEFKEENVLWEKEISLEDYSKHDPSVVILSSLPVDYPLIGCEARWSVAESQSSANVDLELKLTSSITTGFPLTMVRVDFAGQKKTILLVDDAQMKKYSQDGGEISYEKQLFRYSSEEDVEQTSLDFNMKTYLTKTITVEMGTKCDLIIKEVHVQMGLIPAAVILSFDMMNGWSKLRYSAFHSSSGYIEMLSQIPLYEYEKQNEEVNERKSLHIPGSAGSKDGLCLPTMDPVTVRMEIPRAKAGFRFLNDELELKNVVISETYLVQVEISSMEEKLEKPYIRVQEVTGISKAGNSLQLFKELGEREEPLSELWIDLPDIDHQHTSLRSFYVKSRTQGQRKVRCVLGYIASSCETAVERTLSMKFNNPFSAKIEFLPKDLQKRRKSSTGIRNANFENSTRFYTNVPNVMRLSLYCTLDNPLWILDAIWKRDGEEVDLSSLMRAQRDSFADSSVQIDRNSKYTIYEHLNFERGGVINLGMYYFVLRRQNKMEHERQDDFPMLNIVEEVKLPNVAVKVPSLLVTPIIPSKAILNVPFQASFRIQNNSNIMQSVKLTTIPSEKFLLAGIKSAEVSILPNHSSTVSFTLIPLVIGSVILPSTKIVSQITLEEVLGAKTRLGIQVLPSNTSRN